MKLSLIFLSIKNVPKTNWSSDTPLNFKPKLKTFILLCLGLSLFGFGESLLIHSTIGSNIEISTNNKILFLEEIGEHIYKIDRMLYSLKRAGYFDECKGLIIGQISDIKTNSTEFGMTINELILDLLKEYNFPIIFDFPAGHEIDNYPIILGRNINIKVKKSKTEVKF